jgi:hypothetical protein
MGYRKLLVLALVLAFALAAGPVRADSPSGTISIEVNSGIADLGGSWLDGILSFQGKTHAIRIKGLQSAIVGVRNISAKGDVYNLKAASDLAGTYHKADPAVSTSIVGEKSLVIQNSKGVVINIRVVKQRLVGVMRTIGEFFQREGVPLDLVPEGLTIKQVQ